MVSTMSAELVSLPLLHEPIVSTAPRALLVYLSRAYLAVFTFCATLKVLRLLARPQVLSRARALMVSPQTKLPLNLAIVR